MYFRPAITALAGIFAFAVQAIYGQDAAAAAAVGLLPCTEAIDCISRPAKTVCAPVGFCGDAGALCRSNAGCYDFCGTDGVCGGVGAPCSTIYHNNYVGYKCNFPLTCLGSFFENGGANGVCGPAP